jgi:hypothetical protein
MENYRKLLVFLGSISSLTLTACTASFGVESRLFYPKEHEPRKGYMDDGGSFGIWSRPGTSSQGIPSEPNPRVALSDSEYYSDSDGRRGFSSLKD